MCAKAGFVDQIQPVSLSLIYLFKYRGLTPTTGDQYDQAKGSTGPWLFH